MKSITQVVLMMMMLPGVMPRSAPPHHEVRPISTRLTAPPPPLPPSPSPPSPPPGSSSGESSSRARLMFSLPRVDPSTMSLSPAYSYGWSTADKNLAQEVDQQGRFAGGYSWSAPGGSTSFAYGAGQYVDALMSDTLRLNSGSATPHGQYSATGIPDHSLSYGPGQYMGTVSGMSDHDSGHDSMMSYGPGQYVDSLSREDDIPQSLERYRPSAPRQAPQERYNSVRDMTGTGTGHQNPWSASFSGLNTNTMNSLSGGNSANMDSSYLMRILGRDSQWLESSDKVSKTRSGVLRCLEC